MLNAAKSQDYREFAFGEQDFQFIISLVNKHTGIVLANHKQDMVYSRLARRLRALRLNNFTDYCNLVKSKNGADEISNLVNAITTNLTSFFRESHHFEHLHQILPELAKKQKIRIWSAGCSSGMEAYSIAMVIQSSIKNWQNLDIKILATDIDTNVLQKGEAGEYTIADFQNISKQYHNLVKKTDDNKIIMSDDLKQMVSFKQLNLLDEFPMKGLFDIIFCRNVVIYFDKPTQKMLFAQFAKQLQPKSWLYIGHSETLFNISKQFKLVGRTIYEKS
jgi:chemotaxis protein methyltransferase CheR